MSYLNFPLFFFLMIGGVALTLNSSSWMTAWLGMELNILGFLPILVNNNNILSYEMVMKYFLISSVSSLIILFFTFFNHGFWLFNSFSMNSIFISVSLAMKLGAAPMHSWFISLAGNLNPMSSFYLMTIQKLPPLFLFNMCNINFMIIFFILFSIIFGSIGGFFQLSTMKLLAYSSLSHMSWIFTCILYFNKIWLFYFILYTMMLIPIIMSIYFLKFTHISKNNLTQSKMHKVLFSISILSFAGFPPLFGFFPKLFIIVSLYWIKFYFLAMFLIFMSIINLYFYLRLMYNYIFIFSFSIPNSNYYFSFLFLHLVAFSSSFIFVFL